MLKLESVKMNAIKRFLNREKEFTNRHIPIRAQWIIGGIILVSAALLTAYYVALNWGGL